MGALALLHILSPSLIFQPLIYQVCQLSHEERPLLIVHVTEDGVGGIGSSTSHRWWVSLYQPNKTTSVQHGPRLNGCMHD